MRIRRDFLKRLFINPIETAQDGGRGTESAEADFGRSL